MMINGAEPLAVYATGEKLEEQSSNVAGCGEGQLMTPTSIAVRSRIQESLGYPRFSSNACEQPPSKVSGTTVLEYLLGSKPLCGVHVSGEVDSRHCCSTSERGFVTVLLWAVDREVASVSNR